MVTYSDKTLREIHNKCFKVYVTDGSFEPLSDGFDFIEKKYQVKERLEHIFKDVELQTQRCILIGTVFCCIVPNKTFMEIQSVFATMVMMMRELDIPQVIIPEFSNNWNDIKIALENSCDIIPADIKICKEV